MLANSDLGQRNWASVAAWTVFGTAGCVLIAVTFNAMFFNDLGHTALRRSLVSAVVLPIVLGVPLFYYLSMRVQKMAILNRYLGLVARTNSLTSCLNRGAFTTGVTQELLRTTADAKGALLMIDADNFKAINDRFGHESGDEALVLIARAIHVALRPGDVLGRMGGEEFGVYLPGVDLQQADEIAERLCRSVHKVVFKPRGATHTLSISVGGIAFTGSEAFSELFRRADEQLYAAKQSGRNRTSLVQFDDQFAEPLRRTA